MFVVERHRAKEDGNRGFIGQKGKGSQSEPTGRSRIDRAVGECPWTHQERCEGGGSSRGADDEDARERIARQPPLPEV